MADPIQARAHGSITAFGIRLSAVFEVALLIGGLLVVDLLFLEGNRFEDLSPHPFWLVVLLVAFQYGTREGIVAAACASLALRLFHWPGQGIEQDVYDHMLANLRLPFLWLASAVLFGELRMRHVSERTELERKLEECGDHARTVALAYERLGRIKEGLETRVASQLQTTTRMYRAARAIDKLHPEDVLSGVTDIVRTVMSPEKFSVFVLLHGRLYTIIQDGWSADDRFAEAFASDTPLFREVIGRQRLVCAAHDGDERILGDQGILAGPLIQPDGDVLGMLKIEKLGFLRLTSETLGNFRIVCEWIATSYGQAVRFQEAESDRILHGETQLYSHNFLKRQTEYVATLARRVGFDLSLLSIHLENERELDEETIQRVPGLLREAVGTVLRRTDLAFHESDSEAAFAILLPGTPAEKARLVIEKLRAGIASAATGALQKARFAYDLRAVHEYERPSLHLDKLFPRQTDFLADLARRFGFAISIVVLRVTNPDELVEEDGEGLPGAINVSVSELLSAGAPAFTYHRTGWEYPVVVPGMSVEKAQQFGDELVARVTAYLRGRQSRAELAFSVQALSHARSRQETDVVHA